MSWQQFIFQSTSDQADVLTDLLTSLGAGSVTIRDAGDVPIFEPPINTSPLWPTIVISALYEAERDLSAIFLSVKELLRYEPDYKIEILEDKDWVREWMENFHPIKFGQNLWICPSWETPPDLEAVNILLDPGLAFGTGTHETTALCLRWLDAFKVSTQSNIQPISEMEKSISLAPSVSKSSNFIKPWAQLTVLDFGCGSGILAIAAHKLGAKKVYAMDIDPQAIQATRDNAEKNFIGENFHCLLSHEFSKRYSSNSGTKLQVDVLIANILAKPLIELSQTIVAYLKPSGCLVLSGILSSQVSLILETYEPMIAFEPTVVDGDWVRLSGVKRLLHQA